MRFAKRSARGGALLVAALAATTGLAGPAHAASPASRPTRPAIVVQAAMQLDCVNLTDSARAYAVSHGYCSAAGSSGGISPQNTVTGSCGSSFVEIFPWGYAGEADINFGFSSSKGAVVYRSLIGTWYNVDTGFYGDWTNSGVMASSSLSAWTNVNSGRGWLSTNLAGYVVLFWGATCYLLVPSDFEYVA